MSFGFILFVDYAIAKWQIVTDFVKALKRPHYSNLNSLYGSKFCSIWH